MRTRSPTAKPLLRQPDGVPGLPPAGNPPWTGLGGTLLLLHSILALLAVLLRRAWPQFETLVGAATLDAYVVSSLIMQGGLIFIPTILIIWFGQIQPVEISGGKARAGSLILALTAGIPAAVVFQGLNNLLIYVLVKSGIHLPAASSAFDDSSNLLTKPLPVLLLIVLVSVIIPALVEELMFRGVILASLSSGGATYSAVLLQAAAFALFHGDPLFLLPPFLAGWLLALVRRSSLSLLPAILMHLSLNLSLLALAPLLPTLTAEYVSAAGSGSFSLLYASLIAAFVAAVALVPLIVLITSQTPHPARRARWHFWPADWKFALAIVILVATMIVEFN